MDVEREFSERQAQTACNLIERMSYQIPQLARDIRDSGQSSTSKVRRCLQIIDKLRDCTYEEFAPDPTWYREYYMLTGDHMVLTEEGWIPAACNTPEHLGADYDPAEVLDEVNAPDVG